MDFYKKLLIPVGIGLGLLALLGVLGSTLFLFREASEIHPALGWLVAGVLFVALFLLILQPMLQIMRLPRPLHRPDRADTDRWNRYLRDYADRMLENPRLEDGPERDALLAARSMEGSPDQTTPLESALDGAARVLDRVSDQVIRRHAAAVFVATGASQSGRLDIGIVLSTQLRMIREIAEIYYQRPGPRELWSIYSNVGGTAFLAGEIQDSEVLAVLGAPVSAALSGFVPVSGTAPLISLLVNSLLDGSANALLTLRIGVLARKYCGVEPVESRPAAFRSASAEAARLLSEVVSDGAKRIASATRRLVVTSTVQGPQTAARSVADAGTTVVSGIARAAGRVGSKAWSLSRDAVRGVTGEPAPRTAAELKSPEIDEAEPNAPTRQEDLVLEDTARFWERVATVFNP